MERTDHFSCLRNEMVRHQIERRGVKDERVLAAMREVPRHEFVSLTLRDSAYEDFPLGIGFGQTISQPYIVAVMSELLELKEKDRVLEIGTGSGYQAAILSKLCAEVYSMDRLPELVEKAKQTQDSLGLQNINLKVGDGTLGWEEQAPFDAIIITAASPNVPQSLLKQLADGGRLVIPTGSRFSQMLQVWRWDGKKYHTRDVMGVVFVPLIGKQGWASGF